MTTVVIPAVLNGAGDLVPATCQVHLETATTKRLLAFRDTDLIHEDQDQSIPEDGLALELIDQASLATAEGVPTWYVVTITTAHGKQVYRVQVPDSLAPVALRDLVGAATIPPADILAGRLLTVAERAALAACPTPPSALNPILTRADRIAGGT